MKFALVACLAVIFMASPAAGWWMENDYTFGAGRFHAGGVSAFANISTRAVLGLNASFYEGKRYSETVFAARLPFSYAGNKYLLSFSPVIYPRTSRVDSSAAGGIIRVLFPLSQSKDKSFTHMIFSLSGADQRVRVSSGSASTGRRSLPQGAVGIQLERSYYNEFFFLVSVSGFKHFENLHGAILPQPVLDQSDMAFLGTDRVVTALPSWSAGLQLARNMEPESDSHVYVGYHRIGFESDLPQAESATAGIRMKLMDKNIFDFTYNWWKFKGGHVNNYCKFLVRFLF